MSAIHLTLMGKGGVGKSFISTIIAQHLMKSDASLLCADTDPTNPTFSSYPAFNAKHINIMTPDMNIDKSNFDELIEMLLDHGGNCVVDNGASSFLPMMAYLKENNVIEYLLEAGKKVYIHAPLIGGLGMDETIRGLDTLLQTQPAKIIVWENEMFGPVEKHGKRFIDSALYSKYKERIVGVVTIAHRGADTFGRDMHTLTSNRMTFKDACTSPFFKTMQRQRLVTVERDIATQLTDIAL
jgi:hypothetical protein